MKMILELVKNSFLSLPIIIGRKLSEMVVQFSIHIKVFKTEIEELYLTANKDYNR